MIAELYGGPYDGARSSMAATEFTDAPLMLTFAAARTVVGWDVATITEATYHLEDEAEEKLRYVFAPAPP